MIYVLLGLVLGVLIGTIIDVFTNKLVKENKMTEKQHTGIWLGLNVAGILGSVLWLIGACSQRQLFSAILAVVFLGLNILQFKGNLKLLGDSK